MAIGINDIEIQELAGTNTLRVRIQGKLEKEDYEEFVPAVEQAIEKFGKIKMLVILEDFKGWSLAAGWEDTKFGVKHFNDMAKIAFVGDKKWEKGLELFCKVFTTAEVRYFDKEELDRAQHWILG